MLVGRFVAGFGVGMVSATVPMYQAELCEAHKRGRLVCSQMIFVGVGITMVRLCHRDLENFLTDQIQAVFVDYGMLHATGPATWRVPIAIQAFFTFVSMPLSVHLSSLTIVDHDVHGAGPSGVPALAL